jgi:outer membrane protein OmpA-like peptidoglycan-associated protein
MRKARPIRRSLAVAATGALLASAATACQSGGHDAVTTPVSSAGGGGSPAGGATSAARSGANPTHTSSAASSGAIETSYLSLDQPIRLDALALGRVNSKVIALRIRLTDVGTASIAPGSFSSGMLWGERGACSCNEVHAGLNAGDPFGGLVLVSGTTMRAYHPLTVPSNGDQVAQTGYTPSAGLDPGKPVTVTILYPAPPAAVTALSIFHNETTPVVGIPLADHFDLNSGDPDPRGSFNRPAADVLQQQSDALSHTSTLNRIGSKVNVQLNSDVLFAYNKYNLTPAADAVLKQVAKRIDDATTTTIHVDGYTDSTGPLAHNETLSERRAQSVEKRLKELVHRGGISWAAAGHGPSHPVATNDTAAGRQRNRRVTVSIQ